MISTLRPSRAAQPLAALARSPIPAADQRARRGGAERDQRAGSTSSISLSSQCRQAATSLLRRRLVDAALAAQLELEVLDRVGDVDASRGRCRSRRARGRTADRPGRRRGARQVFLVARLLADEHQARVRRALAEDRLRRGSPIGHSRQRVQRRAAPPGVRSARRSRQSPRCARARPRAPVAARRFASASGAPAPCAALRSPRAGGRARDQRAPPAGSSSISAASPPASRRLQARRVEDAAVVGAPEFLARIVRRRLRRARAPGPMRSRSPSQCTLASGVRMDQRSAAKRRMKKRRGGLDDVVLGLEPGDVSGVAVAALDRRGSARRRVILCASRRTAFTIASRGRCRRRAARAAAPGSPAPAATARGTAARSVPGRGGDDDLAQLEEGGRHAGRRRDAAAAAGDAAARRRRAEAGRPGRRGTRHVDPLRRRPARPRSERRACCRQARPRTAPHGAAARADAATCAARRPAHAAKPAQSAARRRCSGARRSWRRRRASNSEPARRGTQARRKPAHRAQRGRWSAVTKGSSFASGTRSRARSSLRSAVPRAPRAAGRPCLRAEARHAQQHLARRAVDVDREALAVRSAPRPAWGRPSRSSSPSPATISSARSRRSAAASRPGRAGARAPAAAPPAAAPRTRRGSGEGRVVDPPQPVAGIERAVVPRIARSSAASAPTIICVLCPAGAKRGGGAMRARLRSRPRLARRRSGPHRAIARRMPGASFSGASACRLCGRAAARR